MVYELPTEAALSAILSDRLGYQQRAADETAGDLLSMRDRDLRRALADWVEDQGVRREVGARGVTASALVASGLTYPAALIMVDWIRSDPDRALEALMRRM